MDNSVLPTYKEIFGEVLEIEKDGFSQILSLDGENLTTILIDSDFLLGVKVGEFVNIKKQIEFMPPFGKNGGLNKLRVWIKHFTREQGKNLTFEPIKEKFEKFIEIENYNPFDDLKNSSFFKEG